jgi:hypothetical protein
MIEGSCLCGKIKFNALGELKDVSFCHCSICRKTSGSAFASYGATTTEGFEWITGIELLSKYEQSVGITKYFCGNCSTTLVTHHFKEPDLYHISLGCLDGSPEITPLYHQYFNSRPNWSKMTDSIKKYSGWPTDEE